MQQSINRFLFNHIDTAPYFKHTGYFLSQPRFIILEVTNRCNITCSFCLRQEFRHQKPSMAFGEISPETVRLALGQVKDTVEFVGLNGFGEPLSHSNFVGIVREARQAAPKAEMGFHTNGIRLDAKKLMPAFVEHAVSNISVSLDAVDEASYRRLHNDRDRFSVISKNIADCVRYVNLAGSGPKFSVTYTIVPGNENQLIDFVKLTSDLGVSTVGPIHVVNKLWSKERFVAPDGFKNKVKEALAIASEEACRRGLKILPPDLDSNRPGSMGVDHIPSHACAWPVMYAPLISWNGDVVVCCWIPSSNTASLGNIYEMPLKKIWNGARFRRLRQTLARGALPSGCNDCHMLGVETQSVPEEKCTIGPHRSLHVSPAIINCPAPK
jgi:radical SAM protein with 4Fe4S-binding SPASM domain